MGKLRTSLMNATKLIANLQTTSANYGKKLKNISKGTSMFMKGGEKAIDECFLYLSEKLKKDGITYKSVENEPIRNYLDKNVANYLSGMKKIADMACSVNDEYAAAVADKSLDKTVEQLGTVLTDIQGQIKKKKKKLLKSKKYKAKISLYEKALQDLASKSQDLYASLEKMRKGNKPPSSTTVRNMLGITPDHTLKQLEFAVSQKTDKLYKVYNSLVMQLDEFGNEMREHVEFGAVVKTVKEMAGEADEIDQE